MWTSNDYCKGPTSMCQHKSKHLRRITLLLQQVLFTIHHICKTQSLSVHWLSSSIFTCFVVVRPSVSLHGNISFSFQPLTIYLHWDEELHKDKYRDKDTQTQTRTDTKCFQDPIYAIFIKSREFKDLKCNIDCLLVMTKTKTFWKWT